MKMRYPIAVAPLLAAFGSLLQSVSGWWDFFSHKRLGDAVDPWWNPAHIGAYSGLLLVILGVALFSKRASMEFSVFSHSSLFKLTYVGVAMEILAGISNEAIHLSLGIASSPIHFAAHALFTLGLLVVPMGLIWAFSFTLIDPVKGLALGLTTSTVFLFCYGSLWLTASGAVLYIVGAVRNGVTISFGVSLLAFTAAILMTLMMRRLWILGSAVALWLVYWVPVWVLLMAYFEDASVVALGLVPAIIVDGSFYYLGKDSIKRASLVAGALAGLMVRFLYYPLTSIEPAVIANWTIALNVCAGIIGGLAGQVLISKTKRMRTTVLPIH